MPVTGRPSSATGHGAPGLDPSGESLKDLRCASIRSHRTAHTRLLEVQSFPDARQMKGMIVFEAAAPPSPLAIESIRRVVMTAITAEPEQTRSRQ